MAVKLEEFYNKADKLGSMKAKMRLALMTGISNVAAANAPDSPENISMFEKAMSEIEKEYK